MSSLCVVLLLLLLLFGSDRSSLRYRRRYTEALQTHRVTYRVLQNLLQKKKKEAKDGPRYHPHQS